MRLLTTSLWFELKCACNNHENISDRELSLTTWFLSVTIWANYLKPQFQRRYFGLQPFICCIGIAINNTLLIWDGDRYWCGGNIDEATDWIPPQPPGMLHINLNKIWILIKLSWLFYHQTELRLVLNLSEQWNYNPNLVWTTEFRMNVAHSKTVPKPKKKNNSLTSVCRHHGDQLRAPEIPCVITALSYRSK